jgi:hypothetical protein
MDKIIEIGALRDFQIHEDARFWNISLVVCKLYIQTNFGGSVFDNIIM